MLPALVEGLVSRLRRRGVPLGVDDLDALRTALAAGFGWRSTAALRELCVSLWAKSRDEAAVIRAVFASLSPPDWNLGTVTGPPRPRSTGDNTTDAALVPAGSAVSGAEPPVVQPTVQPHPRPLTGTTPLPVSGDDDPTLLLIPQYPVSARAVAQVWRRMRRPVRSGPAVELDIPATIRQRARSAVCTPPVLVPPRRNTARLVLLIDCGGSMTPYDGFVDHVRLSIQRAARLDELTVRYFHDLPGHADRTVLAWADTRQPDLDRVLAAIERLPSGRIYRDPGLTRPDDLDDLVGGLSSTTGVAVISDAGASRGRLDTIRLLDTVALLKLLHTRHCPVVWLNPVPAASWGRSTAALIARHVPMFPLTLGGMYGAVEALRGRTTPVVRPL